MAIEQEDLQGIHRGIGRHQDDGAALGMLDNYESDQLSHWAPYEIDTEERDTDGLFPVEGTDRRLVASFLIYKISESNFVAVLSCSPSSWLSGALPWGPIRDPIAANPRDKVMSVLKKGEDDLSRGIECVGYQNHWVPEGRHQRQEEGRHLIEKSTGITVRPHYSFMNTRGQGNRSNQALWGRDQQRQGLEGVPHYERVLRVVSGFLMELLDRRHFLTVFRNLDTVRQANEPPLVSYWLEDLQYQASPKIRELIDGDPLIVNGVQQSLVGNTT